MNEDNLDDESVQRLAVINFIEGDKNLSHQFNELTNGEQNQIIVHFAFPTLNIDRTAIASAINRINGGERASDVLRKPIDVEISPDGELVR